MADVKPLILDSGTIKQIATGDTLGVANGGTGATTLTDNGVLIGNGTGAVDVTTAGTTGQVLVGVTGGNPLWGKWFYAATKSASQSVTSSTSLVNCTSLSFPIGANETWNFRIDFRYSSNGSGGFKWDITVPSGASGNVSGAGTNNICQNFEFVAVGTGAGATFAVNNLVPQALFGTIVNGSTAGVRTKPATL